MPSRRRKKKEKVDSDDEDNSKNPSKKRASFTRAAVNDIRDRPISYLASIALYSYMGLVFLERISSVQGSKISVSHVC